MREASQRKSLQGLDNIAAGGADGFDAMQKVLDILEESGANLIVAKISLICKFKNLAWKICILVFILPQVNSI